MEKTQKILKKFISLILTFAISFGSYVFPVFAALPEDNEAPTIEEVVDAYDDLKTKGQEVNTKIGEIKATNPAADSAKAIAVDEVESYLNELNDVFGNNKSDPIEYETLKVITTKYNVITVIVDFKLSNLGITLTNETMKQQVLTDTYSMLQEYYYQLELMFKYLEKSEIYTDAINLAGEKFDGISDYIEILDELEITYDKDLYETYALELAKLMVVDVSDEDIQQATKLSNDLDTYESSIITILKNELVKKLDEFKTVLDNTTLTGTEIDDMKTFVIDASEALKETNISNNDVKMIGYTYIVSSNYYEYLELQNNLSNPTTDYIDSVIADANEMLSKATDLNITIEQIQIIQELINDNSNNVSSPMDVEGLTRRIESEGKLDLLSEKLISGELNYEILAAYADLNNNHGEMIFNIDQLYNLINSSNSTELVEHLDNAIKDIYTTNGGYIDRLNNIGKVSKTDEERLEVLNKLDLFEHSLNVLKDNQFIHSDNNELITPITEKIEELREFYSKSADNKLTGLTVNGIEMDVTQETYKVYVGNDVTELTVVFEKSNSNAKVEVLNGKDLKVGTNEVIVLVTAENGEVREYKLEVIRAEAKPVVTTENKDTDEAIVKPLVNNTTSNETVEEDKEEHKNTSDSNEKYNEEVEEEGLSFFTVLLIVAGIAAVAYGVYKIFGEKEDQKIEKAFEQPKANQNKPSPSKKKNQKKRK